MRSVFLLTHEIQLTILAALLLLACDKPKPNKPSTDDTAPTHDTDPAPDTDSDCDTGYLDDDGECVPAACGTGTWGNLEVEESTVYVDIGAAEGGDGSEGAPFTSIQAGLDAAGDAGGGMVAVTAGSYPETLELGRRHDGVHLAGRCRELVIVDASVGDESTPGIEVDVKSSEVEVSGVTVRRSQFAGVLVRSGTATLWDSAVVESVYTGVGAHQAGRYATVLTMEACEVTRNTSEGVLAYDSGTSVTLRETAIEDTQPDEYGNGGYGIGVTEGASLDAEGCNVRDSTTTGVLAYDSGTSVTLRETIIENTQPGGNGKQGYGIAVAEGASLDAEGCEVMGNTTVGVAAVDSGTSVTLRETSIEDTKPADNWEQGYGIAVAEGASLDAEGCEVVGNTTAGVIAGDAGTSVTLRETIVADTKPAENGESGFGIQVYDGANLDAEACEVERNTAAGVIAARFGTLVILRDTRIASTMRGEIYTVGFGAIAQASASVVATGIEVSSNKGPGFYASIYAYLTCSGCVIRNNQFAGAVAVYGASLDLYDSLIEGTTEQENIGGGVGLYAQPWGGGPPPILSVTDTTIQDNLIAGVWLSGRGSYSLSDNAIHGGEGWTRESPTKCGDAVYARDGVTAWDGSTGLLLENNELLDGLGAGLFLDNASATLSGNSYADNAVDLVKQGSDCATPPHGVEDEALGSVELCPAYDYATCGDEFSLYLTLEDPESGHGAALMSPAPPGPGELRLPALPVVRPHAFEPPPLLPPAPRLEPPQLHLQPLRHEPAPPVPLVVPSAR